MTTGKWRALLRDESGKGMIKFALGTCLMAVATATMAPGLMTNPVVGNVVMEMRHQLPETLEKARKAMGGH